MPACVMGSIPPIIVPKGQVCLASTRSRHPSVGTATAGLGHADLLLRNYDVAWRALNLTGQSPGNRVSFSLS